MLRKHYSSPHIKITTYSLVNGVLTYDGHVTQKGCKCPGCGQISTQVRSRYVRTLMDLPLGSYPVKASITVRRFKCNNIHCSYKIFSEQIPGTTTPYARRTSRVSDMLRDMLVEVSSMKGAHLTSVMKIKQSSSTCLRIISALPVEESDDVEIIGIDDWAFRKGISYGTIIVDAITGHPIDLINSRKDSDVIAWLKRHPKIKIVTRDRASSYAKAIRTALPDAIQIADKFHIIKNLSERTDDTIRQHYAEIRTSFLSSLDIDQEEVIGVIGENSEGIVIDKDPNMTDFEQIVEDNTYRKHKAELFTAIHQLHEKGLSQRKIAFSLNIHRETVRLYLRHDTFPQKRIIFTHKYEQYTDLINDSCRDGKNVKEIFTSIKINGFRGQLTAFYSWFRKNYPDYNPKQKSRVFEVTEKTKCSMLFNSLSPRKMAIYVSNPEWGIGKSGVYSKERILANNIISSSSLLQQLQERVVSFRGILKGEDVALLEQWMDRTTQINISGLNSFVNGIRQDMEAVKNAIRYKWTNGLVEGNVNRLKTKKREMYGRAGFELLRRKVVMSNMG